MVNFLSANVLYSDMSGRVVHIGILRDFKMIVGVAVRASRCRGKGQTALSQCRDI